MHNKVIEIYLFKNNIDINYDQCIRLKTIFNTTTIKFLLQTPYNFFIFFINLQGILEIILFDKNPILYCEKEKNIIIISHCQEKNLFTIKYKSFILKDNTSSQAIQILKENIKKQ
jgi:hypothetical protein